VLFYRNGIFAGYLFDFEFTQPVEAKQFLGIRNLSPARRLCGDPGRWTNVAAVFVPPYSLAGLASLNDRNLTALPGLKPNPLINQVTFRMDYDGSKFQTELLFLSAPSLQQFGLAGEISSSPRG